MAPSDIWIQIAAGYQVGCWPVATIAEALGADNEFVQRKLREVANFIELTLRPPTHDDHTWTVARVRAEIAKFVPENKE